MSNDPDDKATVEAAATLKDLLSKRGHTVTRDEARRLAFITINTWIQARTSHWAVRRGTPKFAEPDAMTVGFAEAMLKVIAEKSASLPFDQPIGKWAKNDVARFLAIGAEAIEAARVHTLEDPTHDEVGA